MQGQFYKLRKGRLFGGVLAGLADKFGCDTNLLRFLYAIFSLWNILICLPVYVLLAYGLPFKEDLEEERFGTGPRKRKEAEKIKEKNWFW